MANTEHRSTSRVLYILELEETKKTISQNFLLSLLTYSLGLIPVTRLNTFEK